MCNRDTLAAITPGKDCAICCTLLSAFGVIVLVACGLAFHAESEYLGEVTDKESAARGCFIASMIYAILFFISAVSWYGWDKVPQTTPAGPDFMQLQNRSTFLPGTNTRGSAGTPYGTNGIDGQRLVDGAPAKH
eukprot:gnl/Spiro4/2624_TR1265_c0_g1_i1.p1 gnl/Spiro4/2624_TR1265_c0_g1~~gnl/Spiro4/2624_TR1265_c0_g1_i1.p1  ORF type:complete len:156 (+),score=27.34 gnl/Spiro4/2624_TR1265_c0_g1_i1:69-470(+)